jgi:hypothetical protein
MTQLSDILLPSSIITTDNTKTLTNKSISGADNTLTNVDGSSIINGTNISSLNASNISTGTVPAARLGSGTADDTTYLRGDNTWQTISSGGGGTVAQIVQTNNYNNYSRLNSTYIDVISASLSNVTSGNYVMIQVNGMYYTNPRNNVAMYLNLRLTETFTVIHTWSTVGYFYLSNSTSGYMYTPFTYIYMHTSPSTSSTYKFSFSRPSGYSNTNGGIVGYKTMTLTEYTP